MNKISKAVIGGLAIAAATLGVLTTTSASAATPADNTAASNYHATAPVRLLDTRASHQTLGAGSTLNLMVAGTHGVPADATAVSVNVTATNSTAGGFLTMFPGGTTRTTASTINFAKGETIANAVPVQLGATGSLSVFNLAGTTDVVVDLEGYFTAAAPAATPGVGNVLHNSGSATTVAPGASANVYATCATSVDGLATGNGPATDYVATGGGYTFDGGRFAQGMTVYGTRQAITDPNVAGFIDGHGWIVQVHNSDTVAHTATAWVVCVNAPGDNSND